MTYALVSVVFPAVPVPPVSDGKRPIKLLAKYNYKANVDRPGGFDELSLTQGERLEFIQAHPINPFWWQARNSEEQMGYVPASYLMVNLILLGLPVVGQV